MPQAPANFDRAVDVRQSCMSLSLLKAGLHDRFVTLLLAAK